MICALLYCRPGHVQIPGIHPCFEKVFAAVMGELSHEMHVKLRVQGAGEVRADRTLYNR